MSVSEWKNWQPKLKLKTLNLGKCVVDINFDWRIVRTTFRDGNFTEIWAQDTPEFISYARILGYDSDVWRHFREHDVLHTWLSIKLGLPYSLTLWTEAHAKQGIYSKITRKSQGIEEFFVTEFQKFLNGADPSYALDYFINEGYTLESLKAEGLQYLKEVSQ
jgi:hypothetical protein